MASENKKIIDAAINHTIDANYETGCYKAFDWWLEEDAFDEDFKGFKYSYSYVSKITSNYLKEHPDYKCCDANCDWCK